MSKTSINLRTGHVDIFCSFQRGHRTCPGLLIDLNVWGFDVN